VGKHLRWCEGREERIDTMRRLFEGWGAGNSKKKTLF